MKILKLIIALFVCAALFLIALHIGGYTWDDFKNATDMKDPNDIFGPYLPNKSDNGSTTNNSSEATSNNSSEDNSSSVDWFPDNTNSSSSSVSWFPDDLEFSTVEDDYFGNSSSNHSGNTNSESHSSTVNTSEDHNTSADTTSSSSTTSSKDVTDTIIKVGDEVFNVTKDSVSDFIKWLQNNYKNGDSTTVEPLMSSSSELSNSTSDNKPEDLPPVVYNSTLQSEDDLKALINSIQIVDSLSDNNGYDRDSFESPTQKYSLNGSKVNRNDYAWKTSPFFNEEDFTYTCPYTGIVFHDEDDGKKDNDFSKLDFDHIVPLSSAYQRGARNWTPEQQNEYAYNQWIGVDVQNSANRSKSDKGLEKYLPPCNVEDYCYSFLMICSKYNLVMTQKEINICNQYIGEALASGEPVTHLGGSNL